LQELDRTNRFYNWSWTRY